ncbi:unnamed protein product [Orchesella dallaii]|uniref:SH2 domain-containing protein n=1 Tax=Orchesella dallaii TaxID=48710 RepID=A0ABP1QRV7_9HEXA
MTKNKQVMSDCVPSPSSDSSYASSSATKSSSGSSASPTCEISLLERLIRTHPIWFLPSLQRSGALHLLQGREVGNFIVRSSTQPLTMALSVKLPGNHVEHYLLKAIGNRIALENSTHTFETVHQLIAHYCDVSDEIPVCLRVPTAIAEAISRQQLRSYALLGQEFWTHSSSGSGKELSSPSDVEVNKNFLSSGLESHSSSSQTSLCDGTKKPCRPTTLELGGCSATVGGTGATCTPPPVPPRWSRSALLTPLSLPSSIQSTPSEVQSTFSEKSSRPGKKKKRNSGGNKAESIHYKDTEILDLFKGTKTIYDDKASDYEDIWSPHERAHTPRLSTFKPDLIASSLASDLDTCTNILRNKNNNKGQLHSPRTAQSEDEERLVENKNAQNNRHSLNGQHLSQVQIQITDTKDVSVKRRSRVEGEELENRNSVDLENKKSPGLYSEPVDSIAFRRFGNHRHSEPNIRWSQPVLSLLKLDFSGVGGLSEDESRVETVGTGKGKIALLQRRLQEKREQQITTASYHQSISASQHHISNRESVTNVAASVSVGSELIVNRATMDENNRNLNSKSHTCVSVDNLYNSNVKQLLVSDTVNTENKEISVPKDGTNEMQSAPEDLRNSNSQHTNEASVLEVSNNQSWRVDNSWEFVMWQKNGERHPQESTAKFPVLTPPNSPHNVEGGVDHHSGDNFSGISQTESSLNSVNNNQSDYDGSNNNLHRFSRYDNLEIQRAEDESSEDGQLEAEGQEKISAPWDSSKWEHLLRLVSESTQQLDSLQMLESSLEKRRNLVEAQVSQLAVPNVDESKQRISKILEVSGNVDKASKSITSAVRKMASTDDGVFGPTLKSFISCTISAKTQDPNKVMRNVRQFISGMKNFLVGVSPETTDLRAEIKKQTEMLNDSEFLNIDSILEEILVDLVIAPLTLHIRGLIDSFIVKTQEPLTLNNQTNTDFKYFTLDQQSKAGFEKLKGIYSGFEDSVSPIKKLDKWNEYVCQVQDMENYSSDSFLPLLTEMLGATASISLPSHVEYMIGLLPHSLAEQNNYSLSLLQSAVSGVKCQNDGSQGTSTLTSVRVIVPDERNGTLIRKVVPVRESTTNKEVAKMVASKLGITNPGDYVLVKIKDGEEKLCIECDLVSESVGDTSAALAYKRIDAKIGWPQRMS